MTTSWTRRERIHGESFLESEVIVPDQDVWELPVDTVERLLREAGYEPQPNDPEPAQGVTCSNCWLVISTSGACGCDPE